MEKCIDFFFSLFSWAREEYAGNVSLMKHKSCWSFLDYANKRKTKRNCSKAVFPTVYYFSSKGFLLSWYPLSFV